MRLPQRTKPHACWDRRISTRNRTVNGAIVRTSRVIQCIGSPGTALWQNTRAGKPTRSCAPVVPTLPVGDAGGVRRRCRL